MDKVQEEFEQWAKKEGYDVSKYKHKGLTGCYCSSVTGTAYIGWLFSRNNLCLQLPKNCKGNALTVSELKELLDKAGIKYEF